MVMILQSALIVQINSLRSSLERVRSLRPLGVRVWAKGMHTKKKRR